jgi:hypothetical protein
MKVIHSGDWLYFFTGRHVMMRGQPQEKDTFSAVQAVRISDVTSIKYDEENFEVDVFFRGGPYPIHVQFGYGGCHSLNASAAFVATLKTALGLDPEHLWGAQFTERGKDIAELYRREVEELDEIKDGMPAEGMRIEEIIEETERIKEFAEKVKNMTPEEKKEFLEDYQAETERLKAKADEDRLVTEQLKADTERLKAKADEDRAKADEDRRVTEELKAETERLKAVAEQARAKADEDRRVRDELEKKAMPELQKDINSAPAIPVECSPDTSLSSKPSETTSPS